MEEGCGQDCDCSGGADRSAYLDQPGSCSRRTDLARMQSAVRLTPAGFDLAGLRAKLEFQVITRDLLLQAPRRARIPGSRYGDVFH